MSLTSALGIAQRSLLNTARQTSVVSQNITNAQNPDYSRRSALLVSTAPGASVVSIQRATSTALFKSNLAALSSHTAQTTLITGLDNLALQVNGADNARSASTLIGKFQEALQSYATTPSSENLAENAVEAARQLAKALNDGSTAIQSYRSQTDQDISSSVSELNDLLSQFERANREVIQATQTGADGSDALDQRDALLKQISELVPISTSTRAGNDMMITTTSGITLFETVPRNVSFQPIQAYSPTTEGNAIYIDGVPLSAGSGANTTAAGSLAAMIQMRDEVTVTMQDQLDEIARGLISSMAETDATGSGLPALTGLFTWSGGPALPADGAITPGLAGDIRVNPAVDSTAGGDVTLLRDGGINGADYIANTTGGASFSDLVYIYSEKLDAPMAFDPAAGIDLNASVTGFASSAISWLELGRQQATSAAEVRNAQLIRTSEALSNETGVNIDQEMALLLDLEHSYQASARLIQAVDEMLSSLMAAVG
jgi:flagellar hook-associated protein 1 FlgK